MTANNGLVTQTFQVSVITQYCDDMIDQYGYAWYYGDLTSAEQNACYPMTTVTVTVPATGNSDGLVTEGSAKMPGACDTGSRGKPLGVTESSCYNCCLQKHNRWNSL